MKVLTVLTDHISSVRALAAVVNKDGSRRALSALLVSAGGRAQMQCYRLLIGCNEQGGAPSCQVIQIAAHRLDDQWEKKRNRHKMVKMDPETRYMSMAVLEQTSDPVILAVACSDGAVSEVDRRIGLLWESFHHQRCVLCVATCCLQDTQGNRHHLLLSAATDGQIALWNFTSFLLYNQFPPSPIFTVPAHQSGVNSMDILPLRSKPAAAQRPPQARTHKRTEAPQPPTLVCDSNMAPWGGLDLSESSFTSLSPLRPPSIPPPPPPVPHSTPASPHRTKTQIRNISTSTITSTMSSPSLAQAAPDTGGAGRGLRSKRRPLPQRRAPRPPRLPPLRQVSNLSFSRSFTFSFFELPLHQSPRCRAERTKSLLLLIKQVHF
uniref:Uncharacterized protein n=1 Tax=Knipowitschia caucasica TaxID=637954 RepID=A0AAV2LXU8_KNICA